MSLTTRTIIFIVAVVAFVAAILVTAARAQYAQDSWYEPPAKITIELHRVTPHHRTSKRVTKHHRKEVMPLENDLRRSGERRRWSRTLPTHDEKPRSAHLPAGAAYPLVTSQLYQEFVAWCLVGAKQCILPRGGP